jgi:hypothetical protein
MNRNTEPADGPRPTFRPTPAEIFAALVTLASWIALYLQLTGRLSLGRSPDLLLVAIAMVSTVATFVVSSGRHAARPRPRSVVGKFIVWAVILAALGGIAYLVVLGVVLRDGFQLYLGTFTTSHDQSLTPASRLHPVSIP